MVLYQPSETLTVSPGPIEIRRSENNEQTCSKEGARTFG